MKNTIIILALLVCAIKIQAQDDPVPGSYITNNTMGAFHGTWQWTSGIDTVKIYLTTQKVYFDILEPGQGFYWDCLVGWHLYKKGNQIIESSFSYVNTPYANGKSTIFGGNENTPNILGGDFKDISKHKSGELKLTLNAAQNQLTWRLTMHQGMRVYAKAQDVPPAGFTLPHHMVLVKQ